MGIETRVADFNDPDKLAKAFEGADTLVLISMPFVGPKRQAAHKTAIDAAVAAGVRKLVYTSIVGAGHKDIDTCVVANNMGDGRMAFISRDDCALAAACAAMSDWEDRIIDVNGAELLTIAEYLAIASEVTGKKVVYKYIDDDETYAYFDSIGVPRTTEEMWADTAKNFPFCSDGMVTFGRAIRLNQMNTFTNDFEKLTGQKPITVKAMLEDMENHQIGTRTSTDA